MNELIGIRTLNTIEFNDIKKDLLIFDEVFIIGLQEWKEIFEDRAFKNPRELLEHKELIPLNDFVIHTGLLEINGQINKNLGSIDNYYYRRKTNK